MMRWGEAPSAARTAISFCRVRARASCKFAMLAHAISSTNPTAPSNIGSSRPLIAKQRRGQWHQAKAAVFVIDRVLLLQPPRDHIEFRLRLRERDPGLDPAHDIQIMIVVIGKSLRP